MGTKSSMNVAKGGPAQSVRGRKNENIPMQVNTNLQIWILSVHDRINEYHIFYFLDVGRYPSNNKWGSAFGRARVHGEIFQVRTYTINAK